MTFKKDPELIPCAPPTPSPTTGGTTFPKKSSPSDVKSTVSYPSGIYHMTTIHRPFNAPSKTPVPINKPILQTEAFKNFVKDISNAIPYLTASMSYKPEKVILQLVYLRQELKVSASTYQASVPLPRKYFLVNS